MGEYIRDPKGAGGSKFICAQDGEDYEQELLIKRWLESEGMHDSVELKHINRKGLPRNTLVRAAVRLDQQVRDDSAGTFADLIAGSDGRDLEIGSDLVEDEVDRTSEERLDDEIKLFCDAIGVGEGTESWIKKSVRSTASLRNLQLLMKEETQSEISLIDLEWSEL